MSMWQGEHVDGVLEKETEKVTSEVELTYMAECLMSR